jgi:pSer/pThr/pTyr-binding forkhead associated (FHA) protein
MFALIIADGVLAAHALPKRGQIVLGRGAAAQVAIRHASISRRHALLHVGPTLAIEDLGSANGTRVGGRMIRRGHREQLAFGAEVELGDVTLIVQSADV